VVSSIHQKLNQLIKTYQKTPISKHTQLLKVATKYIFAAALKKREGLREHAGNPNFSQMREGDSWSKNGKQISAPEHAIALVQALRKTKVLRLNERYVPPPSVSSSISEVVGFADRENTPERVVTFDDQVSIGTAVTEEAELSVALSPVSERHSVESFSMTQ
jgi:hypothetical protein